MCSEVIIIPMTPVADMEIQTVRYSDMDYQQRLEYCRERNRAYYARNKDKKREYYQKNREACINRDKARYAKLVQLAKKAEEAGITLA